MDEHDGRTAPGTPIRHAVAMERRLLQLEVFRRKPPGLRAGGASVALGMPETVGPTAPGYARGRVDPAAADDYAQLIDAAESPSAVR